MSLGYVELALIVVGLSFLVAVLGLAWVAIARTCSSPSVDAYPTVFSASPVQPYPSMLMRQAPGDYLIPSALQSTTSLGKEHGQPQPLPLSREYLSVAGRRRAQFRQRQAVERGLYSRAPSRATLDKSLSASHSFSKTEAEASSEASLTYAYEFAVPSDNSLPSAHTASSSTRMPYPKLVAAEPNTMRPLLKVGAGRALYDHDTEGFPDPSATAKRHSSFYLAAVHSPEYRIRRGSLIPSSNNV